MRGASPREGWGAPLFAPGETLAGRYRIVRFIAAGGMGEVYEAEDLALGTEVALKTIRPEVAARGPVLERFRREILLARRVTHPNVCRIFDLGQHSVSESGPAVIFMTMELLSGETLRQRLHGRGPLGAEEAFPLVTQMAAALGAAHEVGVVHRDFKSSNVMLVPPRSPGTPPRVAVTDFGLAWSGGDHLASITRPDDLVGTPAYVAPEQVEGREVTASADIYAFGVVLYEVVTGHLPFEGDSPLSTVFKRFREAPVSPRHHAPDLPLRWEAVILRCLEREAGDRFATADQVVKALSAERLPRPRGAGRRRLVLAAVAAAAAAVGGGAYVWKERAASTAVLPGRPAGAARRAVAVLGFKNLSGNAQHTWLSTALAEMLTVELGAGARLRTIPGENVSRMKADLGLGETESLGSATLARIRSHLGADAVLFGSYLALGDGGSARVRLDLRLQDAAGGETLASITETGAEAEIFDLVSRAGQRLRASLDTGQLTPVEAGALRASRPVNAEAVRLHAEGLARLRKFDALGAQSLLEQATREDPHYAPAQAALAEAWAVLGYDAKAAEAARRAYEGATEISREERLVIEGRFREVNREWRKAVEVYRSLWTFFPDDLEHGLRLAAAQISAGEGKDARATLGALRKLPPPASEDPRIELTGALASEALSDFKAEREEAADAAARAKAHGESLLVARARLAEANALRHLGQPREATEAAGAARQLYETVGDRGGVALSLKLVSSGLTEDGDLSGGRRAAEQGLAIRRDLGDRGGTAEMLNQLGGVLEAQGDMWTARRQREEALALFREVGNPYGVAVATFNLANIKANIGDHEGAQASYEAALQGFRDIGNQKGIGAALTGLGDEMKKRGQFQAAKRNYDDALAMHRETGDVESQALCRVNLGIMATLVADLDEAQLQYDEGVRLAQAADSKAVVAVALAGLGEVQLWRGDFAGARRRHEEALAMRAAMGQEKRVAESRMSLAEIALEEGRIGDAEKQSRVLPGVFTKLAAPEQEAHARAIRARALLAAGDVAGAQAEVRRARSLIKLVVAPEVRFELEVTDGRVQAAAGDATGAAKSLEGTAAQARAAGVKAYELEARLALGEVEVRSGRTEAGRARLREVEAEATDKGLALVARQAKVG